VYLLAGDWCVDNDQKMDAIGYYEKAGAYDKLMEVVYTLPQTLPEHISLFLLDIMDRAPEELYRKSPRASILHTRLLLILGRLDEAAVEARRIIEKFEALPASAYKSWTLYGSYMNLGFVGMLSNPYSPDYDFSRFFEKGSHHCRLSGIELRGSLTVINVGSYACRVGIARPGEIERYIQAVAATEPHLSASMNGCSFGLTDLVRTEAAYFKGDLDNAIQFAYQSLHKAQKRHQYEIETRTLFYLLRLAIARGKHTRIREFFTFLEAQLGEKDYVNRSIFYDIVTGWFYAHIGQTGKVAPWIMDDMKEPDLNFLMRGSEILARVKVYFAEKKYAAALAVIKDKSPYGLEAFLLGRLEIKVLEAVCLYHEQQPEAALEALEAAYDLSRPNEFTMPFIEMGRDMGLLTRAALKNQRGAIPQTWLEKIANNSAAYAKKMSAVIQNYREETGAPKDRDLDISRRERNILIGLSQGLTREEIARDGAVSINTVKSSISALYSKLGAVNRADAIRIATSLGVLKGGDKE
jgi:LuxR family maltose regulon positive regulatory protein